MLATVYASYTFQHERQTLPKLWGCHTNPYDVNSSLSRSVRRTKHSKKGPPTEAYSRCKVWALIDLILKPTFQYTEQCSTSVSRLWSIVRSGIPAFVCSGLACERGAQHSQMQSEHSSFVAPLPRRRWCPFAKAFLTLRIMTNVAATRWHSCMVEAFSVDEYQRGFFSWFYDLRWKKGRKAYTCQLRSRRQDFNLI